MNRLRSLLLCVPLLSAVACGGRGHDHGPDGSHDHGEGEAHSHGSGDDHEHAPGEEHGEDGGGHELVSLGRVALGSLSLQLAQGHGAVEAGRESHLRVELPYDDGGTTTVRAWIGGADRTLSFVGKGTYDRTAGSYDVHATAPDPLPADTRWWIEVEQPDGTKLVGSAEPLRP